MPLEFRAESGIDVIQEFMDMAKGPVRVFPMQKMAGCWVTFYLNMILNMSSLKQLRTDAPIRTAVQNETRSLHG